MATTTEVARKRRKVFYGWWVAGAASGLYMFNTAAFTYGFSLFVPHLSREYGWTRTQISTVWTVTLALSLLSQPVAGWLIDRYGPRIVALVAGPLVGLGWMATLLLKWMPSYWLFFLTFALLVGAGMQAGLAMAGQTAIVRWFRRKRARAMGWMSAGTGAAGLVTLPLVSLIIRAWGWQAGAFAMGALVFSMSIPMALLLRSNPESYGTVPDGEIYPQPRGSERRVGRATSEQNFTLAQALRTTAFWVFTAAYVLRFVGIPMTSLHLLSHLTNEGISPERAAFVLSMALAMTIPGKVVFGWLGDRFDLRAVFAVSLLVQSAALATATFTSSTTAYLMYIYAVLWGTGTGSEPLGNALRADLFGRAHFGKISGIQMPVSQVGRLVGGMLGGLLFDMSGSYRIAFLVGAGTFALSGFLVTLLRQPRLPQAT